MDSRSGRWSNRFWDWVLPGLAALEPYGAAYSLEVVAGARPGEVARRGDDEDAGQVIQGPFLAAEARR